MRAGILSEYPKFKLETAPSGEVVTLAEAKDWLRQPQEVSDQDSLIQMLIDAAISEAEDFTGRKFLAQTWSIYWDGFPPLRRLEIPLVPYVSLVKFEYLDFGTGGWLDVPADTYEVDDKSLVPGINLASLVPLWPITKYLALNCVHVKVNCGYTNAAAVPAKIKSAILRMVSTWYDNPAEVVQGRMVNSVPVTASRQLWPFKVFRF